MAKCVQNYTTHNRAVGMNDVDWYILFIEIMDHFKVPKHNINVENLRNIGGPNAAAMIITNNYYANLLQPVVVIRQRLTIII